MFIQAKSSHTISTPFAEIDIEPGALSAVESNQKQTRVRSFGTGGMKIFAGGRDLRLAAGQELLLQRDRATKADSLPNDGLARRRLEQIHIAQNVEAVIGDFSVFSALSANQCLKPIRLPQSADDRKLNGNLLKSAVALDMATGRHGRYFVQPNETASVPDSIFQESKDQKPNQVPNLKLARVAHAR